MAAEADDVALLRSVAAGDERALASLYDRHAGWLMVRMSRRCASADTVDQALQDTFLALWHQAGRYRGGGEVAAFIWGIGVRRLMTAIRKDSAAARGAWAAWLRTGDSGLVRSAEDEVLLGIEHGRLGEALARLSPELRAAMQATVLDGLTCAEAGRLLGVPGGHREVAMSPGPDRAAGGTFMTGYPTASPGGCAQVPAGLVAGYSRGALGTIATWSLEAHLPGCAACRSVLAATVDQSRLDRNRSVVLATLGLPVAGPAERVATRWGVPPHLWRLLSVTPSLRRSWLTGVAVVLVTAVGAARVATLAVGRPAGLLPFLILAPLLPLAGVAAAFYPGLDPAADLAIAAPISSLWLFCVRSVAVIAAALAPVMLAAWALPGGTWLPLLVVLPALAVSVAALALATLTGPRRAAIGAAAGWVAAVVSAGLAEGSPVVAYSHAAQAAALFVIIGACVLLALRRNAFELGWNR